MILERARYPPHPTTLPLSLAVFSEICLSFALSSNVSLSLSLSRVFFSRVSLSLSLSLSLCLSVDLSTTFQPRPCHRVQ